MEIRFVKNKNIDRSKWDTCLEDSTNGLFYGRSIVYDTLAPNWDALVMGDYEAIIPLANRKKFGLLPYIYQPYFVQQGGVFSKNEITSEMVEQFLKKIPKTFVRKHLHLNYGNPITHSNAGEITSRVSLQIDLNVDYETLHSNYNKDARKNLSGVEQLAVEQNWNIGVEEVVEVYRNAYASLNPGIQDQDYMNLIKLMKELDKNNKLIKLGLFLNKELLACGLFVIDFGRIHYCLGAPSEIGRKYGATHALIDIVIKKFANQPLVFDFEGSEIPNVASFYKKFGPVANHFPVYKSGI